jgi:excisionase family DNA binding protein
MTTTPVFYTVSETAEILRVSDRTIREWIYRQNLRAIRMGDRSPWRIPRSEINRLERGR